MNSNLLRNVVFILINESLILLHIMSCCILSFMDKVCDLLVRTSASVLRLMCVLFVYMDNTKLFFIGWEQKSVS